MSRGSALLSIGLVLALLAGHPALAAPDGVEPVLAAAPPRLDATLPGLAATLPGPEVTAASADDAAPEPAAPRPDWKGLRRDTGYFLGYQFVAIGVLYLVPEEITNWDKSGDHLDKWGDNVRNPTWDEDAFYINYVLHPYWGATYYIRGRERGLSRWQSVGYSALLSALYEYGAEAFFERPSYQDLIVTPLLGSLLGEYVFAPLRDRIKAKSAPLDGWDKFALLMTDPLGAANDFTDRLFGVDTQVSLTPFRGLNGSRPRAGPHASALYEGSGGSGARPERLRSRSPTWGVQLEVRW